MPCTHICASVIIAKHLSMESQTTLIVESWRVKRTTLLMSLVSGEHCLIKDCSIRCVKEGKMSCRRNNENTLYDSCSESNTSYLTMLACNIRSRLNLPNSNSLNFVTTWQTAEPDRQMGNLAKWFLTWKCVWGKGWNWIPPQGKKLHPLTFINTCSTFMKTKQ